MAGFNISGGGGTATAQETTLQSIDSKLSSLSVTVSSTPALTDAQLRANPVPVSGTFFQATQPVSGPLTNTELRASAVPVSGAFFQATQPVSGPLTNTELRANPVPVSGTFFQATQPVSGPLTNTELRANPVPVSGTFFQATQPVSGPLTNTELRLSPVPVSGPLTNTELRLSPVPVSGTFFQATQPVSLATVPAAAGRNKVEQLFNDYSVTSVTTLAYTELTASSTAAVNKIEIFDSSGEALILAVGSPEVDQLYIFPGGNGAVDLFIPAGSRITVKAKTATASSGFLAINLYS